MVQLLFIPGTLPGLNEIIAAAKVRRGKWSRYLEMKATYTALIQTAIRRHHLKPMTHSAVNVLFIWQEATKRRDKDNIRGGAKFILDALQAEGILETDGWAQIDGLSDRFEHCPAQPGVRVLLHGYGAAHDATLAH